MISRLYKGPFLKNKAEVYSQSWVILYLFICYFFKEDGDSNGMVFIFSLIPSLGKKGGIKTKELCKTSMIQIEIMGF